MYQSIFKSKAFILKVFGITLSLTLYLSSLHAQQTQPTFDNTQSSLTQSEIQKRLEIEQHRKQANEEGQKKLIPEAIAVIEATKRAIAFAKNGQDEKALSEIGQATGKIDILLARHPKDALLPIDVSVNVIDTAPQNNDAIKEIGRIAETAVKNKNYPDARLLLNALRSEINMTFYSLPLVIYPAALKDAAYLLDQKKTAESVRVLETALRTLVVINQVIPIPILNTIALLSIAETQENLGKNKDKDAVLKLIDLAKDEIERAKELGYKGRDEEYTVLNDAIKNIKEKVESNQNSTSAFGSLKDKLRAFVKRLSGEEKKSQTSVKN